MVYLAPRRPTNACAHSPPTTSDCGRVLLATEVVSQIFLVDRVPTSAAAAACPRRNGATRHDLLNADWHVVHDQVGYTDVGPDWAQRLAPPNNHRTRRLVHQLEQLGHTVTLEPVG